MPVCPTLWALWALCRPGERLRELTKGLRVKIFVLSKYGKGEKGLGKGWSSHLETSDAEAKHKCEFPVSSQPI